MQFLFKEGVFPESSVTGPSYQPRKQILLDPLLFGQGFFRRPAIDRNNEYPPESDEFENAPAAIVLLHELGHRILQINDPTHYNDFRGTILVLENVFRHELGIDNDELRKAYSYKFPKLDNNGNPVKDSNNNIEYITRTYILENDPTFLNFARTNNIEVAIHNLVDGEINYAERAYIFPKNRQIWTLIDGWNEYSNKQWKTVLDFIDARWSSP